MPSEEGSQRRMEEVAAAREAQRRRLGRLSNVPIGEARVEREGTDATIVTFSRAVGHALDAAEALAAQGVSVEVLNDLLNGRKEAQLVFTEDELEVPGFPGINVRQHVRRKGQGPFTALVVPCQSEGEE